MFGGKSYTQADIVSGSRRVLANGAVAGYVKNAQGKQVWRIVDSTGVNMGALRSQKRGQTRAKVITKRQAQIAFNKHYRNRKGSPRGNKQARTYDVNHTGNVVNNAKYLRSPHLYDFEGVDTGSKVRAPRTAAQQAHDQAMKGVGLRRQSGGARGRKAGSMNRSKHCGMRDGHTRCNKKDVGKNAHLCHKSRKTGRCRKTARGRASTAHKSQAAVARGRALLASMRAQGKARNIAEWRAEKSMRDMSL